MFLAWAIGLVMLGAPGTDPGPEEKALRFLVREVPRWATENHCHSCHNNGDAARALYVASRQAAWRGLATAPALKNTTDWLVRPEGWDHNGGEGDMSDKRLATIQFANALATAVKSGHVRDPGPLRRVAQRLVASQAEDGSFPIDGPDALGTPATYGRPLATAMTIRALRVANAAEFARAIQKAEDWLAARPVKNTLDACARLLARAGDEAPAVDLLKRGQGRDGGWGPYVDAPAEVFDTALAVLALSEVPRDEARDLIARGRTHLIARQSPDGSWPETTRPSGGESYAQRLSTTGWATLALLRTHHGDGDRIHHGDTEDTEKKKER